MSINPHADPGSDPAEEWVRPHPTTPRVGQEITREQAERLPSDAVILAIRGTEGKPYRNHQYDMAEQWWYTTGDEGSLSESVESIFEGADRVLLVYLPGGAS